MDRTVRRLQKKIEAEKYLRGKTNAVIDDFEAKIREQEAQISELQMKL